MFGLLKVIVVIVILMVGVGFALEYLPGSDAADWGKKAAQYGMKGARGSMTVVSTFVSEIKELKAKGAESDEEGSGAAEAPE